MLPTSDTNQKAGKFVAQIQSKMNQLGERYAAALYSLARESDTFKKTYEDVQKIEAITHLKEFQYIISSPHITHNERVQVIGDLAKNLKISKTSANFLNLVAQKKRAAALQIICHMYTKMAQLHEGDMMIDLKTAHSVSAATLKKIEGLMAKKLGHKIILNHHVDASLLKGSVLQIGSTVIDASAKKQLNQLEHIMNGGL